MSEFISEHKYNELKKQHAEACKTNDYSKMIISGDENDKMIKKYESQFCKHSRVDSIQGGQVDTCLDCGKTWG